MRYCIKVFSVIPSNNYLPINILSLSLLVKASLSDLESDQEEGDGEDSIGFCPNLNLF